LGSPRAAGARLFPCVRGLTSDRPSTGRLTAWLHPPHVVSPLQSSFATTPLDPVRAEPPARVLDPRHDITGARPLMRGLPSPRYVPSTGVLSLSTVFSARRLRGLLHPRAMFRASSRSGVCRSRAARPGSSPGRCPLAVGSARPREDLAIRTSRRACLDFEALLHARAACVPAR